jgi:hypothetical protein
MSNYSGKTSEMTDGQADIFASWRDTVEVYSNTYRAPLP